MTCDRLAEQLQVEIIGKGEPVAYLGYDIGTGVVQPEQTRRQVAGVGKTTGLLV